MFSNYTLLVPGVTVSDLGNYTCVVLDDGEQVLLESSPASVSHACKFKLIKPCVSEKRLSR